MKLIAFLLDLEDLTEQEVISPNSCILGKWINEYGWEAYKDYPEMQDLVDLHNKVHEIVSEILNLKKDKKLSEANKRYKELEKESDKLINLLKELKEKEERRQSGEGTAEMQQSKNENPDFLVDE